MLYICLSKVIFLPNLEPSKLERQRALFGDLEINLNVVPGMYPCIFKEGGIIFNGLLLEPNSNKIYHLNGDNKFYLGFIASSWLLTCSDF